MKKTLLFLASLLMTMGSFAQNSTVWSEDFSSFEKDAVPAGGAYSYVCEAAGTKVYNEKLAGGEAPELLVGKTSGSFSATVPMNGISGDLNLTFKANRALTVEINGTAVEATAAGNDYTAVTTVAAGTENVTIKFSNTTSKNIRLDNIKFFTGTAKKAAGLSWGTASRSVTLGAEDNLFPTLTNTYNLPVTYTSSDNAVATINADGAVTLLASGTTDISASFAGNDEYEAATVTYTLTVKDNSGDQPSTGIANTPETAYTVAKALELIAAGEGLSDQVYVKGKISYIKEVSAQYGNATFNISDDGQAANELVVFRAWTLGNVKFTDENQIKVDDDVVMYGTLVNYVKDETSTPELSKGYIYSLNGTTGINDITAEKLNNAPVYNLAGQRVGKDAKGILIQNGKKFVK